MDAHTSGLILSGTTELAKFGVVHFADAIADLLDAWPRLNHL
jgi:hypothetical protein